ncbi:hypothetical protein NHX12_027852 [Muraenolepis orangiensis]|uniref:Uncharacterized protein n=1 Tax=Muraenolepis orangiensis TaxID=630683 RepID=A0A9Q0EHP2_9TELE|nr:hypothetical protein NHX12_027852 [Muraenolepis orangiensis]
MESLQNRTAKLALHMQTKEELVNKIRPEIEPLIKTATGNLEMDVLRDVGEVSPPKPTFEWSLIWQIQLSSSLWEGRGDSTESVSQEPETEGA